MQTDKTPKVSIITVNYNNLDGMKKTYQSIVEQTYNDWEWIVIDGGSGQNDTDFIRQHEEQISYWCSEPDKGPYNGMNKGIVKACGQYFVFMNSGDTFYDAEVLHHVYSQPRQGDVLYGDWAEITVKDETTIKEAPKVFSLHALYYDNICHQAMFVKGNILKDSPYDESYTLFADWAKWLELTLAKHTFEYVPYVICRYQLGGISNTRMDLVQKEVKRLRTEEVPAAIRETISCIDDKVNIHPLAYEANCLIKKKKLYKKIIHMAIRIIHLIEK
jgi:glycosyltransferase involved in cell wall biosynthesis